LAALAGARGIAVHVVVRGYGGRLKGPLQIDPQSHDAVMVGDEALMIAAEAPCWVARDRLAGARAAASAGAELVLLDDGFQDPGIVKDLSFVVVDAETGFGNGRLIPAGPLREPVAAGLARAGAVVLLGDGAAPAAVEAAGLPVLRARLHPLDGGRFAHARVVAFAGIGRPQKFFASLAAAGADIVAARAFADHHPYRPSEIARLRRDAARAGARLVTTAKDWARLPPTMRAAVAVLPVAIRWDDPGAAASLLFDALPAACDGDHDRHAVRA
jgi:tetraacyldisaccharide 4'-kinase